MEKRLLDAATVKAIELWKKRSSERTELLLRIAQTPKGSDPRFWRVLAPSLQIHQDPISCADRMLAFLLESIESTEQQNIADPKEIVNLVIQDGHPRIWQKDSCKFPLGELTFYIYTSTSHYGVAIGLGTALVTKVTKKMKARDCADVILAMAENYNMCKDAANEIRMRYGAPYEAIRKVDIIRKIKKLSEENS